ncbi:hypothetical protein BaRGS_00028701, partial [Batillaria attramentaria]
VTTETTNPNFNNASYKTIQPKCVLEGARVTVANRLAEHGDDWSKTFARFNSGTYNNQWMVVDYKQYDEYFHQILPGFLTVLEQIPGKVHYEDQTKILLNTSYWASYNIPYYTDIFEAMGMPEMVSKYGEFFTHDGNPRARIFRRDQSRVKDVDTMTKLMRYNDYKNDPLSRCNCTPPYSGLNGISARGDLNPPDGKYPFKELGFFLGGGTDMKLTSIGLTRTGDMLAFRAISGPTFDPLPPFRWSTAFNSSSVSHLVLRPKPTMHSVPFYAALCWSFALVMVHPLSCVCAEAASDTCEDTDVAEIYVTYDVSSDHFEVKDVSDEYTAAYARFKNCINSTGFAYLSITTVNDYTYRLNSSVQAYAAGLAEGYITRELISLHYQNTVGTFCQPKTRKCRAVETFLRENLDWVTSNVEANSDDQYWYQVRLFYEQFRGLQDGYTGKPGRISMDVDDVFGLYLMQIQYEIPDIEKAVVGRDSSEPPQGHCSVLIKLLPGNDGIKDVLMAHDTWTTYDNMLRVLKLYDFYFHKSPAATEPALGRSWAVSSYPGVLTSLDDFYVLSSAMVTTETTNPIFNDALYKHIQPKCVLEGVRVTVANRLAEDGDDWSETFARFNSGTYNNQWMVVDYKQYDEYFHQILPGFLTVLEQIPGKVHHEDVTEKLINTSYWASYNIPYFQDIFEAMGLPDMVSKFGDYFTHDGTPRAKIFRRDHPKVKDVESMTRLMRYNDFMNDPLSRCNCTPPYSGDLGISARNDLNLPNGSYPFKYLQFNLEGGTDMKLTSIGLTRTGDMLAFRAISGPTFDPLPPFRWSTAFNSSSRSHLGQPDLWNFGPIWFNGTF